MDATGQSKKELKKIRIEEEIRQQNERDANKYVTNALIGMAIILIGVQAAVLTGVFSIRMPDAFRAYMAGLILISLSPTLLNRTAFAEKYAYKYYLLVIFISVIGIVNVLLPKHGILAWATCIVITCHYYTPKTSRAVFIICLIAMISCIYLGILFGEWDANLLNGSWGQLHTIHENQYMTYTARIQWMEMLQSVGENRWLTVFLYYCLPRSAILTLTYTICRALNFRTIALMENQQQLMATQHEMMVNKDRIESELNLATNIQASMLPQDFPLYPNENSFDVYATMNPAKEVGGDFYDIFMVDDNHLAVVMADVSGKGVPAALFMAVAKNAIKIHALAGLSPADTFTKVNQMLCEGNDAGLFVTAWMGILDLDTGLMQYANAGHNPPLFKTAGGYEYIQVRANFVLAGMSGLAYRQHELQFSPGDRLYLYTDGVTEATNINDELYGEDRLITWLNDHQNQALESSLLDIKAELDAFAGEREQFDDITMLLLDYAGRLLPDLDSEEETFEADFASIEALRDFVEDYMETEDCSDHLIFQMSLCMEEIFVNIVKIAYKDTDGDITLRLSLDDEERLHFVFSDNSMPFNPLQLGQPELDDDGFEKGKGSFGILIVRNFMDEIKYERLNNENRLTLIKALD